MPIEWDSGADWDAAVSEDGVVHESVTNTDHNDAGTVKRGYSAASPMYGADLSLYYPLHEDSSPTAYDLSGNGNDGAVNGPTQGVSAPLGTTCYSFDGTDDYIDTGWKPYGGTQTVSIWLKPAFNGTTSRNNPFNVFDNNASESWGFQIETDIIGDGNYDLQWVYYDGSYHRAVWDISADSRWQSGTWVNVVGVYDGSTYKIYANGTDVTDYTENVGTGPTIVDRPAYIGCQNGAGSARRFFNGDIWEVRVWDGALTASEIQAYYDVVNTNGTLTSDKRSL